VTPAAAAVLYAPAHRDPNIPAVTTCVIDGIPFDEEYEIVTPSGRRAWVRSIGEPVRDDEGRVVRVQGAFQDISEKKRAEGEVRSASARLHSVLESLSDAFFTVDRGWRITYLNRAGEKLLQLPREELLGRRVGDAYPGPSGEVFHENYRRALEERRVVEFEARYEPLGLWLEVRVHPTEEGLAVSMRDVSERRQEREALRLSVERFRGVARATSDAVWDWNIELDSTWWSEGMEALFGHPLEEMSGGSFAWSEYIPEEDRHRVLGSIYGVLQSGAEEWSQEYRFARRDGSVAWVLDRGFVIRDKDGKALRMVGGMTDLTERREAELELARLNRALRMRSACNESLIRASDETALLAEVCRVAVEIGGYRMAWVGYAQNDESRSIQPVSHAGFEDGYLAEISLSWSDQHPGGLGPAGRSIRGGLPEVLEDLEHSAPQGPWHEKALAKGYHGILSLPLRDREAPFGLLGLYTGEVRPITEDEIALLQQLADDLAFGVLNLRSRGERERAEAALRASEERVRSTFAAAAAGIAISSLGGGGFFVQANRAFCDMVGYSEDELRSLDVTALTHPDDLRETLEMSMRLVSGELDHLVTEKRYLRKDGQTVWARVSVSMVPPMTGEPTTIIAVTQDVTALKAAEEARQSLENQLREAQKMEAIGTLAGGIAHDFNNILGAILGNAELARLDAEGNEPALESLEEIRRAGLRAKELIRQILSFSRREASVRRAVALRPIAEESVRLLRATLPSRAPIQLQSAADLPAIHADPIQLQQVLLNLGTNAVHAMAGRPGSVDITIDRVDIDRFEPDLHPDLAPGTWVRLSVIDRGHGMDETTKRRIFEPFFTTKPVGEGTGLGLPVVHGIVREHEGVIVVDSAPDVGTRFDLYFPAANEATADAPVATVPRRVDPDEKVGTRQVILYVDDDAGLLSLIQRLLSRRGYDVVGHVDARAALDELRSEPGRFDLVLTDYNMPKMSGLDVSREVHEIRADLPVAITSGYITDSMRADAEAAGVRAVIFKPDVVDALCDEVARVLSEFGRRRG
jgi:PAS domain S-box-containing protein